MRTEFDYTMMSAFLNCRRRYNFRHNRGLVPKVEATPLTFGSAMHGALDVWHKCRVIEPAIEEFHRQFTEDLDVDTKRTNAIGEWILKNYAVQYATEPFKVLHTEMPFDLELPNVPQCF